MGTILINDHKTGFVLTQKTIEIINKFYKPQIHSKTFYLFCDEYKEDHSYILLVRHPKEIIISGYLYHKKCSEKWAVKQGGHYYYDYWGEDYFGEKQKAKNQTYLNQAENISLPVSYQEKLNNMSQDDGIIHEMNHVAKMTIDGMCRMKHYNQPNTFTLKFEDLVFKHDDTVRALCKYLGVKNWNIKKIIKQSREHNILVKKEKNLLNQHTTNLGMKENRYLDFWNEKIEEEFVKLFPEDVLSKFAYE